MTTLALYASGDAAPPVRTLMDILETTAAAHPAALALDDGRRRLDYRTLSELVQATVRELGDAGIGRGDRVGVRIPSGTVDLYIAILAILAAGAAYVPVDADDPAERARLVFSEAGVRAVVGAGLVIKPHVLDDEILLVGAPVAAGEPVSVQPVPAEPVSVQSVSVQPVPAPARTPAAPTPDDDAWIIFTSGSTGKPKGVAVTHRNAAAFVDAEARLFLTDEPIAPGDRVLAGLSVAFDASCEEMWLAWRYGACLVPAPRALVRSGLDLGPWLQDNRVTIVSTVPTLAALWPADALDDVRLLIFGGEACPPELAERLAVTGREVWNTYGPTEATVVACGMQLTGGSVVRIGLPLDGWDLVVVDGDGRPVPMGETGELVIGGVGLARYLDPAKDAEKYAPLPSLGWERAYRSGDLVRADPEGLVFVGRADEQVKLGGRRIELGEIDAALQALPGVAGAAAAVKTVGAGNQILIGYVVPLTDDFDPVAARGLLAAELPAALVPRIAVLTELPTRTSGKVDRNALPWPLESVTGTEPAGTVGTPVEFTPDETRLGAHWAAVLGEQPPTPAADFFSAGGSSLGAARLIALLRTDHPTVTVGDVYQNPTLARLATRLADLDAARELVAHEPEPDSTPVPRRAQLLQIALMVPLATIGALRWVVYLATFNNLIGGAGGARWAPQTSWWWVLAGWLLFVSPFGRVGIAAGCARLLLRGLKPGVHPRAGSVHLRLWTAEQIAERIGVLSMSTIPWNTFYARLLGADIGRDTDLHSPPPITGMLRMGTQAAIEPEVDLAGYWIDGDRVRVGEIRVGAGSSVGARSTLFPGAKIGKNARVQAGSGVAAKVPTGELWAGAPARRLGKTPKSDKTDKTVLMNRPARTAGWSAAYGLTAVLLSTMPLLAALPSLMILRGATADAATPWHAFGQALWGLPAATVVFLAGFALLTLVAVRLLSIGLRAGEFPVHSRNAWQTWTTSQLMSVARVWMYPVYASVATPVWLRALGMKVGHDVEASTVLAVPAMTTVADGAFLADDTMIAPYELVGGRFRVGEASVGERAFLGNSGMVAPGRKVPKGGLVGVLSAAPQKAKRGSSYVGMPPVRLRRSAQQADRSLTYDPPRRLKVARAAVEVCRIIPMTVTAALALLAVSALDSVAGAHGFPVAIAVSGLVFLGLGILAATIAAAAKWVLVGRIKAGDRPLWSSFIWRNELADNFVELVAAPWFAEPWTGTPALNVWLRALGSKIGRGVWCETYWLPEADLVTLAAGSCVNRGCVVQTHLFHDRVMSIDTVTLEAGATLGPNSVILPAASAGAHATIGPASLVMRGESVPSRTRWLGNPISMWART